MTNSAAKSTKDRALARGFVPLPSHVPPTLRHALREARERLHTIYGNRLRRVVLYGSQARGDAREESDVDVLVVLRGPLDVYAETTQLADLGLAMYSDFGVYFSFKPFTEAVYQHRESSFMRTVRAEGIDFSASAVGEGA